MKKRLIDFTLEEMQALQKNVELYIDTGCENCGNACKYWNLCNVDFYNIDFKQEIEVPKFKLTEDEKAVLRSIDKSYKWLTRSKKGILTLFTQKPKKRDEYWDVDCAVNYCTSLIAFKNIFQFVKWEDNEPYTIEELLKDD